MSETVPVPWVLLVLLLRDAELGRTLRQWHTAALSAESSQAISAAEDWNAVARSSTFAELERRRAEPGPLADLRDSPEQVRRWVETGSSEGVAA